MPGRSVAAQLDLGGAVERELALRNRLLPPRWDYLALAPEHEQVEAALRPLLRRGPTGARADIVFCNKGWRGVRPLHVMPLRDRILYRALVNKIAAALPEELQAREPAADFRQAPLGHPGVSHISKTDVSAYYEFVDHDLLADELVGQTGEEPTVDVLMDLLGGAMGRRVGLPQVHIASDRLGDTYIDRARRRLVRAGYPTWTYSDDFLIASTSLGEAREAVEACSREVRELGLVLNERKTFTYGKNRYKKSLTSFANAEKKLFAEGATDEGTDNLGFLDDDYADADEPITTLGAEPLDQGVDEEEAVSDDLVPDAELDPRRVAAAKRAWDLWLEEDESEDVQARQEAAITQSLLGRALPTLGAAGEEAPLDHLDDILRFEPALTPQVMRYITNLAAAGSAARSRIRTSLDDLVAEDIHSPWQRIWLAQTAGSIRRSRARHHYEDWLADCVVSSPHDGLAATAAAALGRIGRGDPMLIMAAIDRVGPAWRTLAFWGLIGLDRGKALDVADDKLDRLLLEVTEQ